MALGGGMSCVKYLMFLFNLLFAITGLIIIIVGAKAQISAHPYLSYAGAGFYYIAPVVMIISGVIIFIVSFFGCFGAVKENRCMIKTFAAFLLIILVAELAVGIAGYLQHRNLETSVKTALDDVMTHYNNDTSVQKTFDIIQTDLRCCGLDGPEDWAKKNMDIPSSCCAEREVSAEGVMAKCEAASENLHKEGCLNAMVAFFQHIAAYLGGVGIGIAVVQLLGVIFACCLQRAIGSEYETV